MKRYVILIAAIAMNCCLGGVYAWSVFVPALRTAFGYSAAQTQLVFGTVIFMLSASMIFTGRLQDHLGPRPLAMAAGVLLGAGYLLGSVFAENFWMLWLSIGVIGGLGVGCGYVCPIATGVKWFPRHKALICGLALGGYGAGALLLSYVAEALFQAGWGVRSIFSAVGVTFGLAVVAFGAVLSVPHDLAGVRRLITFRRRTLLKDRWFWALAIGMFCATFPGLMTIGNLKPIGLWLGLSASVATSAIGALSIGNAAGRISWGFLGDHLGGRRCILLSMVAIVAATMLPVLAGSAAWAFPLAAAIVGLAYGSSFALYPAEVAKRYGASVLGSVYPWVILWHGLAALFAAPIGGAIEDHFGSFLPALLLAVGVAAIGLTAFAILTSHGEPDKEITKEGTC